MNYDLLIRIYDYWCVEFIKGNISKEMWLEITIEYEKRKELFIINLN